MALTTDTRDNRQRRTYNRAESIVFLKTREAFGGLSNMAGDFPLCVNGIHIRTSEALYQACRFPHLPEVQRLIIEQRSPMTAKMKSRKHHQDSRTDWDCVRVKIMRWCLRVKLIQNWDAFSELLLKTGDQSIVEQSRKDDFWGAKPIDTHTLVGVNALGRLLMELREEVKNEGQEAFLRGEPLDILNFLLDGRPIEPIIALDRRAVTINAETSEPLSYPAQTSLGFEPSVVKESSPPEYAGENAKITSTTYFEPYPAYKDSGVEWLGEVPAHWDISAVKRHYDIQLGKMLQNHPNAPADVKVPYLKAQHVQWFSVCTKDAPTMWASPYEVEQFGIRAGDLLVCEGGEGGRCGLVKAVPPGCIIQNALHRVRPTESCRNDYLAYVMSLVSKTGWFDAINNKATISHFTVEKFGSLIIPFPPLSEQTTIAEYLDKVIAEIDEAIDKKQHLIELLKELKQITIAEAVTKGLNPNVPIRDSGVEWLGKIPANWLLSFLKRRYQVTLGKMLKSSQTASDETEAPYLRAANIHWRGVSTTDVKRMWFTAEEKGQLKLCKGDLLVCEGGDVGRSALWDAEIEGCYIQNSIHRIRAGKYADTRFLYYWLYFLKHVGYIDTICNKATIAHFTVEKVEATPCVYPPLEEQKKIAAFLDQTITEIDEAIDKKQSLIELLKELKQTTIAEAVTGKIKV